MMKWQEIMGHLCDVMMHTQHIQGGGRSPYFSRPHHEEIFLFMMRPFCIFFTFPSYVHGSEDNKI